MTLNGVMAITLRYFTEFGKHVFQHVTASICGGIYARVYCILYRVYDVVLKKVLLSMLKSDKIWCAYLVVNPRGGNGILHPYTGNVGGG